LGKTGLSVDGTVQKKTTGREEKHVYEELRKNRKEYEGGSQDEMFLLPYPASAKERE